MPGQLQKPRRDVRDPGVHRHERRHRRIALRQRLLGLALLALHVLEGGVERGNVHLQLLGQGREIKLPALLRRDLGSALGERRVDHAGLLEQQVIGHGQGAVERIRVDRTRAVRAAHAALAIRQRGAHLGAGRVARVAVGLVVAELVGQRAVGRADRVGVGREYLPQRADEGLDGEVLGLSLRTVTRAIDVSGMSLPSSIRRCSHQRSLRG